MSKKPQDATKDALSGVDDMKKRIDRVVAKAAAETISEARKDKKTPARNTEEFITKYAQKRFSPSTAGKAYLLSFLLDAYSMSERGVQTTLWDVAYLRSKVQTEEDIRSFDAYYHLTEWLRNLYENSRTMRNALQGVLSDFYHTVTSILAAENIRECVLDQIITEKVETLRGEALSEEINQNPGTLLTLWLNSISIEAYTPQSDGGLLIKALRNNIREGLRYIVAFHTFLDVIADFTGIPECAYLKIKSAPLKENLSNLNEALDLLRDNVKKYREPEIMKYYESRSNQSSFFRMKLEPKLDNLLPASLILWTPKYLNATMENFRPVEEEPPVPEERVQFLRDSIRREFKREYINWYVLYSRYSIGYRIPEPDTNSPTGRSGERKRAKTKAHAEEAE